MADAHFEVRVVGSLGPAGREAFGGLAIDVEPATTVLSGDMDQAALHGVLEQVRSLGYELIDIRRT
jgi:hypothetical protein